MLFLKNLEIVQKYPGMYFSSDSLIEAMSFVAGMDMMQEKSVGEPFRAWLLSNKLKCESSFHWSKLVKRYLEEKKVKSESQVEAFFVLLFEFLDEPKSDRQ